MTNYKLSSKFSGVPLISASFSQKDPDIIPLSFGYPSPDTFPIKELTEATVKALTVDGANALQYPGGEGTRKLVEWVKERSKQKDININNNNILITTGSGQSIDLITRTLTDPGDSLWMEAPTYFGAIRSFRLAGTKITAFPLDENGLMVESVESELKKRKKNNEDIPKFIYIIPSHHNPVGVSLSIERRKKLAKLAYEYNFFIIEDDAYGELNFDGEKIPSVYSFCPERVIYIGTFSKIFGPGLRLGWVIGEPEILDKIRTLKSEGNTSVFVQETMYRMLENFNVDSHIADINEKYKKRRDIMVSEIEENFGNKVTFNLPNGGFFIWLTFPQTINTSLILERAKNKYKVNFFASEQFYYKNSEQNHMRLCFAYCSESQIVKGISLISKAYFEILNEL